MLAMLRRSLLSYMRRFLLPIPINAGSSPVRMGVLSPLPLRGVPASCVRAVRKSNTCGLAKLCAGQYKVEMGNPVGDPV